MPNLANFMESLTQEQEKLVQMGTINTKDQALAVVVLNSSKGKPKSKNLKLLEKKKTPKKPKSNDASSNPSKEKDNKRKEKEN